MIFLGCLSRVHQLYVSYIYIYIYITYIYILHIYILHIYILNIYIYITYIYNIYIYYVLYIYTRSMFEEDISMDSNTQRVIKSNSPGLLLGIFPLIISQIQQKTLVSLGSLGASSMTFGVDRQRSWMGPSSQTPRQQMLLRRSHAPWRSKLLGFQHWYLGSLRTGVNGF